MIALTEEQLEAVRANPTGPIRLTDPRSKTEYFLLRARDVDELKATLDRLEEMEDEAVQTAWRELTLQGLALRLKEEA